MSGPLTLHERIATRLSKEGNAVLTLLLLGVAVALVIIALTPGHTLFKAAVAAWVLLP